MIEKVGIAGVGALGTIVAAALLTGIDGYVLHAVSDVQPSPLPVPTLSFEKLAEECDVVIECLPATAVPQLARAVLAHDKTLLMISACALVLYPEIIDMADQSQGRILVPSGALVGLDAVLAMAQNDIASATIRSTKPPKAFKNAPYPVENNIDVGTIQNRVMIFSGNVFAAAAAFPANVNVAASLALAGIGPESTTVEIWADPDAVYNSHEIEVRGSGGTITAKIENIPDPANPKSSSQAAYSLIAALKKRRSPLTYF